MIVCHCRVVTDRDLRRAVEQGARSLDDISRACGRAGDLCGGCRPAITTVLAADGLQRMRRPELQPA
jgi:bacterioferritin-associated ferredoxin